MQCFPKFTFLVALHLTSRITRFPISSPDITISSFAFDHDTALTLCRCKGTNIEAILRTFLEMKMVTFKQVSNLTTSSYLHLFQFHGELYE